ncbi:MAG: hypothetical protein HY738_14710 [Bacteroidia bacterium]|nr:hypothetical protein [Bacteroidia bacterium]
MKSENRFAAVFGYITIFAWPVALIFHFMRRTGTSACHLRQSLGVHILWVLLFLLQTLFTYIPFLGKHFNFLIPLLFIILLFLWSVGLIRALSGKTKPVPFVGKFLQDKFKFIK